MKRSFRTPWPTFAGKRAYQLSNPPRARFRCGTSSCGWERSSRPASRLTSARPPSMLFSTTTAIGSVASGPTLPRRAKRTTIKRMENRVSSMASWQERRFCRSRSVRMRGKLQADRRRGRANNRGDFDHGDPERKATGGTNRRRRQGRGPASQGSRAAAAGDRARDRGPRAGAGSPAGGIALPRPCAHGGRARPGQDAHGPDDCHTACK